MTIRQTIRSLTRSVSRDTLRAVTVISIVAVLAGQSNTARWFDNSAVSGKSDEGKAAFLSTVGSYTDDVTILNGATGGSAAHKDADNGSGYWYDPATQTFGGAWDAFIAAIGSNTPTHIIWGQGETDIFYLNNNTISESDYETAQMAIFAKMNEVFPNAKILIQRIGRFGSTTSSFDLEYLYVRRAQDNAEQTLDYVYFGCETYDQAMDDTYHLNDYTVLGTRVGERVAALEGLRDEQGTIGPRILSVGASNGSTTITITLDHDGGDDIDKTGSFSNRGWRILINGANRTGSSNVTKVNSTTLELTATAAPSGSQSVEIEYIALTEKNISDLSLYISDNANPIMPLQGVRGFEAIKT